MNTDSQVGRFGADEQGATAIEYGLIVGIIAVVIVGISATGGALQGVYDSVSKVIPALSG